MLQRGYTTQRSGEWREFVSTDELYASYIEFAERRRERHPLQREKLGKFVRRMGAKSARPRGNDRACGYQLGSLSLARETFAAATKLSVEWEAVGEPADIADLMG